LHWPAQGPIDGPVYRVLAIFVAALKRCLALFVRPVDDA